MKNKKFIFSIFILITFSAFSITKAQNLRQRISLDENWNFCLGNALDSQKNFKYGEQSVVDFKMSDDYKRFQEYSQVLNSDFDDSKWQSINLPHDWAVDLPFADSDDHYYANHGFKPVGHAFPQNSIGWYRKKIVVPQSDSICRFSLVFDGVYRNSRVYVNGNYVGGCESGYNSFNLDISDYLYFGKENQIVVMADATKYEGWWYEGAGIYRHVWLVRTSPVHIPVNGMFAHAQLKGKMANLVVETTIDNPTLTRPNYFVESYLVDALGKRVSEKSSVSGLLALGNNVVQSEMKIDNPHLWSIDDPYLYKIVTEVKTNGVPVDSMKVRFGFRKIEAKPNGFFINDKYIKIKGFCNHQDHAGVGTAVPDKVRLYRLQLLKEMGCNAIRIHHSMAPEILDYCDSLGILVLSETRQFGSNALAMKEFENQLIRDRNHPCVFMWCLGNEQNYTQNTDIGRRIALTMMSRQMALDPTRTITYGGNNGGKQRVGINSVIPVRGFNYYIDESIQYKRNNPQQPILATEASSSLATRGVYFLTKGDGYRPDYDQENEPWWKIAAENNWFMGGFSWTGFDYRGENQYPAVICNFGIMDLCGFPKNAYYYYKSWWTDKDVLHIFPHWNWKGKEGQNIPVWCYSNANNVELFLNGKSLGKKEMPCNGHIEWMVKYTPGTLKAVAYKRGKRLVEEISTTGNPYKIVAQINNPSLLANGKDNAIINFSVVDKKGREVPDAMNKLDFVVAGDAKILGVGNGDPSSREKEFIDGKTCSRKLFNGKCQVILQSGKTKGKITLRVNGVNLKALEIPLLVN